MKHPGKWRETENPYELAFQRFLLTEVIGYPHAGNDVFQVKGIYDHREIDAYIKVARQRGADIENEIKTIRSLNDPLTPQVIDHDDLMRHFVVTSAMPGDRLSVLSGENKGLESLEYMYEYGQMLARLHGKEGTFSPVKDRRFFHIPERNILEEQGLMFVYEYLIVNRPTEINHCFCHGDFHYANILWENKHISAILDFELSGIGNREFDIAWAIIVRPGQRFLKTQEEQDLFRKGYSSLEHANWGYVRYYMVLIYTYFYKSCDDMPEYRDYILNEFHKYCG